MRVLLIGAGGLVGSHVLRALASHDAIGLDRRTLDITDAAAVRRAVSDIKPDAIILAAAVAWVEECERAPADTRRVNVDAAATIVAAAATRGAAVVGFSSEYVFDGRAGPYDEKDPASPINEYGRQKAELEQILVGYPDGLVCRTSSVYGWESRGKNFVCQLIQDLRSGRPFDAPSDQLVTPTYAVDLARAVVVLLERGAHGIVHVVGPRILDRVTFARAVCDVFDLRPDLVRSRLTAELGLLAARPPAAGLRDSRLRTILGHGLRGPAAALPSMRATEPGRSPDVPASH